MTSWKNIQRTFGWQLIMDLFGRVTFVLCFLPSIMRTQLSNQYAGPYDIDIKEVDECTDVGTREFRFYGSKLKKVDKNTLLYSTNFTTDLGFSDHFRLAVSIYKNGNGGFKPIFTDRDLGPACSAFKRLAPKLMKAFETSLKDRAQLCPLPPGSYVLKELPLKIELPFPVLPYNKYMVDLRLNYKKKMRGCRKVLVQIIPKRKVRKQH